MNDQDTLSPPEKREIPFHEGLPGLSEKDEALIRNNFFELAMIQGNIQGRDKNCRTIYVTSCFNGEGKSQAAISMAHGLSINHGRVLLVDGNPRSPILHDKYSVPKTPGLLDVLFLDVSTADATRTTRYQGLDVLPIGQGPTGRPDPMKNDALSTWLQGLDNMYDFVIMDGLSQVGSSDGPLLASVCNGCILVVECEKTKWEVVQETIKKISLLGGQPLGLVLNKRNLYIPKLFSGRK